MHIEDFQIADLPMGRKAFDTKLVALLGAYRSA